MLGAVMVLVEVGFLEDEDLPPFGVFRPLLELRCFRRCERERRLREEDFEDAFADESGSDIGVVATEDAES